MCDSVPNSGSSFFNRVRCVGKYYFQMIKFSEKISVSDKQENICQGHSGNKKKNDIFRS